MESWAGELWQREPGPGQGRVKLFLKLVLYSTLLKQEVAFCPEYVEFDLYFTAKLQGGSAEAFLLAAKLVLLPSGGRKGLLHALRWDPSDSLSPQGLGAFPGHPFQSS